MGGIHCGLSLVLELFFFLMYDSLSGTLHDLRGKIPSIRFDSLREFRATWSMTECLRARKSRTFGIGFRGSKVYVPTL